METGPIEYLIAIARSAVPYLEQSEHHIGLQEDMAHKKAKLLREALENLPSDLLIKQADELIQPYFAPPQTSVGIPWYEEMDREERKFEIYRQASMIENAPGAYVAFDDEGYITSVGYGILRVEIDRNG